MLEVVAQLMILLLPHLVVGQVVVALELMEVRQELETQEQLIQVVVAVVELHTDLDQVVVLEVPV
jgi:hypothetical protein